jgi:hypothetical protein
VARVGLGLRCRVNRELDLQLGELRFEVGQRAGEVRVLETHVSRPPLHLAGLKQRRERLGHVVEDALPPLLA